MSAELQMPCRGHAYVRCQVAQRSCIGQRSCRSEVKGHVEIIFSHKEIWHLVWHDIICVRIPSHRVLPGGSRLGVTWPACLPVLQVRKVLPWLLVNWRPLVQVVVSWNNVTTITKTNTQCMLLLSMKMLKANWLFYRYLGPKLDPSCQSWGQANITAQRKVYTVVPAI